MCKAAGARHACGIAAWLPAVAPLLCTCPSASVPQNVQEQLVLWEGETRRVVAEAAYLYTNFEDDELFYASSSHAQNSNCCLWIDHAQRMFAISRPGGGGQGGGYRANWERCMCG